MNFDPMQLVAWGVFFLLVLAMLFFDLFVLHRDAHEIRFKEALIGAVVPVAVAMGFIALLFFAYEYHWFNLGVIADGVKNDPIESAYYPTDGASASILYLTGYVVELSLSADNVFLFILLMRYFSVPPSLQHRVLFWGVLGALVMRAFMIVVGGTLLMKFNWIIYVFGAFLLYTGIKMFFAGEEEKDPGQSIAVRIARKVLPIHPAFEGHRFFIRKSAPLKAGAVPGTVPALRLYATTLFVVLLCIEATDLIFAVDSIPAIFGITKDTFIVFTSNVFAILGLRSLYFLLAGVMDKFHLLKYGLAVVLAFVGLKMLTPMMGNLYAFFMGVANPHWHVDKFVALGVIILALTASIVASLRWPKVRESGVNPSQPQSADAERE